MAARSDPLFLFCPSLDDCNVIAFVAARHAIHNHPGLSIGVPIREFNLTLAVRNNMQYIAIVGINNLLQLFGVSYGLT